MELTEEQKRKIEEIANLASIAYYTKKSIDANTSAEANTIIAISQVLRIIGYDLGDESWKKEPMGIDYAVFKVVDWDFK